MADLNTAREALRKTFGFADFRAGQGDIISAILDGRDVLAVMPTGGGKSLCYQLPALLQDGLTIVVSPLIALMRNQVAQLQAHGIAAGALNSSNSREETAVLLDAVSNRRLRLLYVAPERLALGDTKAMLQRAGVSIFAIDEAHCVSQWGHDFRPDYLNLGEAAARCQAFRFWRSPRRPTPPRVATFSAACSLGRQQSSSMASTGRTCAWPCARRAMRAGS